MSEGDRIEDALERHLCARDAHALSSATTSVFSALERYDRCAVDPRDTALDALIEYTDTLDAGAHRGQAARNERTRAALNHRSFATLARALTDGARAPIAQWMGSMLGLDGPAPLRTTDAFAHDGEHRYSTASGALSTHWARALEPRDDHPLVRGARLYFDVIFLHPFDDGNARLARALLVAALAERPSFDLGPAVWLPKRPGAVEDFWRFVTVCALGAESRARRRYHRAP
ncbi:MAG: Fic family protein [Polyangiales bacterium]